MTMRMENSRNYIRYMLENETDSYNNTKIFHYQKRKWMLKIQSSLYSNTDMKQAGPIARNYSKWQMAVWLIMDQTVT